MNRKRKYSEDDSKLFCNALLQEYRERDNLNAWFVFDWEMNDSERVAMLKHINPKDRAECVQALAARMHFRLLTSLQRDYGWRLNNFAYVHAIQRGNGEFLSAHLSSFEACTLILRNSKLTCDPRFMFENFLNQVDSVDELQELFVRAVFSGRYAMAVWRRLVGIRKYSAAILRRHTEWIEWRTDPLRFDCAPRCIRLETNIGSMLLSVGIAYENHLTWSDRGKICDRDQVWQKFALDVIEIVGLQPWPSDKVRELMVCCQEWNTVPRFRDAARTGCLSAFFPAEIVKLIIGFAHEAQEPSGKGP